MVNLFNIIVRKLEAMPVEGRNRKLLVTKYGKPFNTKHKECDLKYFTTVSAEGSCQA